MAGTNRPTCHSRFCKDQLPHRFATVQIPFYSSKAYIPLRRKKVAFGPDIGLAPQRHYFAMGIPTCWYLKMLNFAFPPTQNLNASQWNIGCVGSLALGLCVGHVHFIFLVLISFALGSLHKRSFQWNMGFMGNQFSLFISTILCHI